MSNATPIQQLISPKEKDLGGFAVRRAFPNPTLKQIGPWVFFDHMGPAAFEAGEGINVRPHPHINIATVTYLFEGQILHRDSIGSHQVIQPGDLNLMVTGSGMVHSEREAPEVKNRPHSAHGLQLWLALPVEEEETDPAFYHYSADQLPKIVQDGVEVRVMMGSAYGVTSPVKTFSPTLYIEARLPAGAQLTLPNAAQRGLYVLSGEVELQETRIAQRNMAVLDDSADIMITATQETQIALIGGDDVGPRFIDWNFVSSRKERIEQAKQQWIAGEFPTIPDDSDEFIPYPTLAK